MQVINNHKPGTCFALVPILLLLIPVAVLAPAAVFAQTTWQWDNAPGLAASFTSQNAAVYAMKEVETDDGPVLFAGGSFTLGGLEGGSNIAKWNGSEWMPAGAGLNGEVRHLELYNGELYAGGNFTMSGNQEVTRVARWNGEAWVPAGSGFNNTVRTMAVFDGQLIAGGWFTSSGDTELNYLAFWDDEEWLPVENELDFYVETLLTDESGENPVLYTGGWFTMNGDQPFNYVGAWDGESWSPVGQGFDSFVQSLALFDDGEGRTLYAGGYFRQSGGTEVRGVAKWNPDEEIWTPVDQQNRLRSIESLYVFDDGFGESLYIGGFFDLADDLNTRSIVRWDGNVLSRLRGGLSGVQNTVFSMTSFQAAQDVRPSLYVGGFMTQADGAYTRALAKWMPTEPHITDSQWDADFGRFGADQFVRAMHLHTDADGNRLLVASGDMTRINGSAPGSIFGFDGERWFAMGNRTIRARHIFTFESGNGPELFAVFPGGTNFLVRWDGDEWVNVGSTPFQTLNDHVITEENGEQILYAVGSSGSNTFVLRFDGSDWQIITQGLAAPTAITWHNGMLYVGGGFTTVAGVNIGAGVARWNPETNTWTGIQGGTACSPSSDPDCSATAGQVRTLHIHDGYLVMGGSFTYAGGERRNRIARINLEEPDSQWEDMGGDAFDGQGLTQYFINALATLESEEGSHLYAGGTFWLDEEGVAVNIVRWNGAGWEPLEEGVRRLIPNQDGYVNHIIPNVDNGRAELFVGGYFQGAGPNAANNIARWFPNERPPAVPLATSPEPRSRSNPSTVSFSWFSVDDAPFFDIQVATDPVFDEIIFNGQDLTETVAEHVELTLDELYYWRVRARREGYNSRWSEPAYFSTGLVTSNEAIAELPLKAGLDQNYPNPFNPSTILPFTVPNADHVRLEVYDILGRRVAVLIDGFTPAGEHRIPFDASGLASGVYIYRMATADVSFSRKMLLLR